MASLTVSAPFKPSILRPSFVSPNSLKPRLVLPRSTPFCAGTLASATPSLPKPFSKNSGLGLEKDLYSSWITASAPQTPATAMRGAESDVMGLLLKERIVFLGTSIDDFVADAIISQLLLLDAQDSSRDIRLFINSPGGSLRSVTLCP